VALDIDVDAVTGDLFGGTPSARTLFRSYATEAGLIVGRPGGGDGFEIWLELLCTRTELREEGFIQPVQFTHPASLDIPLSRIDPPAKSNKSPKPVASAGAAVVVQRCARHSRRMRI